VISPFDDYPIHQTSDPIAQPGSSDRNYYDRYWFNGFDRDGAFVFEVAFGQYPNRFVQDAHFTAVVGGVQHSFHGSQRAPVDRAETVVGPLRIEVVRPLRIVRVVLERNATGLECDLTFRARTAPTLEPKSLLREGVRLLLETTRFTQFGTWTGGFTVGGRHVALASAGVPGTRDRSWGVRPVGEPAGGAPAAGQERGVYWVWAPVHFDDVCTHFGTFEDRDGRPTQLGAAIVPAYAAPEAVPSGEEPGHREMATARHRIEWERGTRRPHRTRLELVERDGAQHVITLEPITRCQLLGLGYHHPEWGHGVWKGEEATGAESWTLAALDPLDFRHIHLHTICRARMGDRVGVGTLETLVFGRHAPSGFREFLDGAGA
jgi:hypothetical protein